MKRKIKIDSDSIRIKIDTKPLLLCTDEPESGFIEGVGTVYGFNEKTEDDVKVGNFSFYFLNATHFLREPNLDYNMFEILDENEATFDYYPFIQRYYEDLNNLHRKKSAEEKTRDMVLKEKMDYSLDQVNYIDENLVILEDLFVSPEYRKNGIAQAVIRFFQNDYYFFASGIVIKAMPFTAKMMEEDDEKNRWERLTDFEAPDPETTVMDKKFTDLIKYFKKLGFIQIDNSIYMMCNDRNYFLKKKKE